MKKVICYLDESTNTLYNTDDMTKAFTVGSGVVCNYEEYQSPSTDIKSLVSAGMSADDLIKLKHGGVI